MLSIETQEETKFVCLNPQSNEEELLFLLPHTGFNVELQVNKLETALNSGLDREKIISDWEKQTREDVWGFWLEYLKKEHLLPINMELKNGAFVANKYGGQTCLEITSPIERDGSVKKSVKKMQDFLAAAPAGSVAILTSPPGWSNLLDSKGKLIPPYPDTQTYVFYLNPQKKLEALTVVSDFSLEDNETFLSNLTDFKPNLYQTEKERIIKVTSSPVLMSPPKGFFFNLEGIIRSFDQINPDAFNLSKALSSLEKLDAKREIDSEISEIIDQIGEYLKTGFDPENPDCFEYLKRILGKVILDMTSFYLETVLPENYYPEIEDERVNRKQIYEEALAYLQTIGGCGGGGLKADSIETPFGPRAIAEGKTGPPRFCDTCEGTVDTFIIKGRIRCALCGKDLGPAEEN